MSADQDEVYLAWLYSQVVYSKTRVKSLTYWSLFGQLQSTEFVWFVANDDNRLEDGKDLRAEFAAESGLHIYERHACSFLEVLVALARRAAFMTESSPAEWFEEMMINVGLAGFNDAMFQRYPSSVRKEVDEVMQRVIYRVYDANGRGGLFPLKHASEDQTKVELWYQLSAYIIERDRV